MNIIAGKYRRRKLLFPKDRLFRPTKSMVREAVFSKISSDIDGASFLDLCAGSGAMGLEAESRGANRVVCVDKDIRYIKENVALLSAGIDVIRSDVIRYLKTVPPGAFDFIYFDPVWADHLVYASGISLIVDNQLLAPFGRLFVEHDRSFIISEEYQDFVLETSKYGESLVSSMVFND